MVDDLNPVLTFTRKEVESLLHFVEEESDESQSEPLPDEDLEGVIRTACLHYPHLITKVMKTTTVVRCLPQLAFRS